MYQNHYVRTSISPLKLHENNINIMEVYVAPEMVMEDNNDENSPNPIVNAQNNSNIRNAHKYRDILQTNGQKHKTVYIVGDVGTGKSAFCKTMIQNWCSAVTEDNPNDKSEDCRKTAFEFINFDLQFSTVYDENINEMRNFDFLFFVPLQRMPGIGDITAMIKAIITAADFASTDLIDRIFQQDSERCLIVADSLDEWTPPRNASVLQHVSCCLLNRVKAKHATLITLSRPSAKGILNMKSSEYDQKVKLVGIDCNSVKNFINNYLLKFRDTSLSYCTFMKKINLEKHEHLEKTPLLLQQLLWLYGSGNEIGNSISDTYSHIVNIMLGWSQNKEETEDMDVDQICVANQNEHMQLPRLLQKFPRYKANIRFLFPLSKVAFEAFTSEMRSSTFSRLFLQSRGVPKEGISNLMKFGILLENKCFDPTQETTRLEFVHISYLEFFAAVYVSSHFPENLHPESSKVVLQDLFQNCKSAADVLHLSNILKMICGLSPFLISELSKLISDIASRDESMIKHRISLPKLRCSRYEHDRGIHDLILSCLSECDSDDPPMISLCDVVIDHCTKMSFLQRIIPDSVIYIYGLNIPNVEVWRWIARLERLQYLFIVDSLLPHNEMELVSSLIEKAPLKMISLFFVRCNYSDCHGHKIDLSKNDQLEILDTTRCNGVKISNLNTKHLEMVRADTSPVYDFDLLLNARSLKTFCAELRLCNSQYKDQLDSVMMSLPNLQIMSSYFIYEKIL